MKKKVLFILFCLIIFFIVSICLLIMHYYVFALFGFVLSIVFLILLFVAFSMFTNCFPNNPKEEFAFLYSHLKNKNNCLIAKEETENIWVVYNGARKIAKFNLKDYPFQKSFICAFYLFHINSRIVKQRNLRFYKTFVKLKANKPDFFLEFQQNERVKRIFLIKNGVTKVTLFKHLIILSPYYFHLFDRHNSMMKRKGVDLHHISTNNKQKWL